MTPPIDLVRLSALALVAAENDPPPAWIAKWRAEAAEAMPELLAMVEVLSAENARLRARFDCETPGCPGVARVTHHSTCIRYFEDRDE